MLFRQSLEFFFQTQLVTNSLNREEEKFACEIHIKKRAVKVNMGNLTVNLLESVRSKCKKGNERVKRITTAQRGK